MKKENIRRVSMRVGKYAFHFIVLAVSATASLSAQSLSVGNTTDAMQSRVARARALAAAHDLPAAATELDAIRSAATDSSIKDVARIMLVGIYLEQGDYTRAGSLLDETYRARVAQDESSTRSYFALAGQCVNGARSHLERYREFGINVADKELPPEAINDLDRLRLLLERVADQAKNISSADPKSNDSVALLEDVAGVRGSLARNERERTQWQREYTDARQKLAANETRVATQRATSNRTTTTAANANSKTTSDSSTRSIVNNGNGSNASISANSDERTSSTRSNAPSTKPASGNAETRSAPTASSPKSASSRAQNSSSATAGLKNAVGSSNGQWLEVGSLVEKATQKISPSYPPTAKSARVAGVVTVYLQVDEKGAVTNVERVNGPQLLRQAAQDAARRWHFRPTVVDGQPQRVTGFINFNFAL